MNRQEAVEILMNLGYDDYDKRNDEAMSMAIAALKPPTPDPDTGLVPCGWCGPERIGWFSVQFWVRASTGKRKWMSVTQQYKKQVNYCPMCGRKLEVDDD